MSGDDGSSSSEPSQILLTFHSSAEWQLHYNETAATSKLMVIDFFTAWCGPCKMMKPFFHELAEKYRNVVFVKIDVDELADVGREFEVQAMPTFVFVKNGKEVDRVTGALKVELEKKVLKHTES